MAVDEQVGPGPADPGQRLVWLRERKGQKQQAAQDAKTAVERQRLVVEQRRVALADAEAELEKRVAFGAERARDLTTFEEANPGV